MKPATELLEIANSKYHYDKETGNFIRKNNGGFGTKKGDIAGTVKDNGYVCIDINGKKIYAHRLAIAFTTGEFPDCEVDHINRDKTDNRLCNLRVVTAFDNSKNKGMQSNNKSGVTGVYYNKKGKCWVAQLRYNHKTIYLGQSKDKDKAINIRKKGLKDYGFHENHS